MPWVGRLTVLLAPSARASLLHGVALGLAVLALREFVVAVRERRGVRHA